MPYADPAQQREYQRLWRQRRRAAYFADKACVVCGSTDNLELDHLDPTQKVSHKIWSWSEQRRLVELVKCQVLCRPCHAEKSNRHGDWTWRPHAKLSAQQVAEIRRRLGTDSAADIAADYPVTKWAIYKIGTGEIW